MTGWTSVPLGDALELAYGKNLPKGQRDESGCVPVYGSNGITGRHSVALVEEPTVIVGRKGSAGAVRYVQEPCFPIDTTYFVRPRAGYAFEPKFLYYLLSRLDLPRLRTATGVPGLTRDDAYREVISFPDLTEQRRIVDLLARAEGIVRLRREAAAKAAELIPALFIHHFGDPATNPMGWPVVELGTLLDEAPTLGTMKKPTAEPQPWLDLRVANIQGGRLHLNDQKWLDLTDDEVARFSLRSGDIVLARAIGSLDHLGKAVVVEPSGQWTFDSHLMRVRLDQTKLLPEVLKTYLETSAGRREFLSHTRRSAVQFNINGKELRRLTLPLPPMEQQRDFLRHVKAAVSIENQQTTALAKAQATFDALLAQAFAPT